MLSIIIPSRSPEKLAAISAHYHTLFQDHPHEIIPILDPPSLCHAYNRGLDLSTGDPVLFSHDDIEFLDPPSFAPRLFHHLESCDVVGLAGTSRLMNASWALAGVPHIFGQILHPLPPPHLPFLLSIYGVPRRLIPNIHAMDGLFLAFRRACISDLRWDAATFDAFHLYDVDTTFRAHLAGYRLAVACDLPVLHTSPGAFDERWKVYAQRFYDKHKSRLAPLLIRQHQFATLELASREEALIRMSPPHWPPEAAAP